MATLNPRLTRRAALAAAAGGALPLMAPAVAAGTAPEAFPLKAPFGRIGTYLNAAATHPIPLASAEAAMRLLRSRVDRAAPPPSRAPLRAMIARLINADEADIAFVPSTGMAENLVAQSLALGPGRGVVTDVLHFFAARAMYGERARRGMPLVVVPAHDGRIGIEDVAAAITPQTRLVALAEISNFNGFRHDMKAICEMAHARGVLVFADVIQSVGAVPIDVRASGVDFCAASTYKWLAGDFGSAFLYVRPDVLPRLARPVVGWRQLAEEQFTGQQSPFDPPVTADAWRFDTGARSLFEVGQPSIVGAETIAASIALIKRLGVARIAAYRDGLRHYARERLTALPGVIPLTPEGLTTSIETFAIADARRRFKDRFEAAGIAVGLEETRIRLSPSFYNDRADIDRVAEVIRTG